MLKSHEKFHSANGKRMILIADDEMINRELLGAILEGEYELLYAADGQEALKLIRKYKNMLSLVLLDLMMPVMSGQELLRLVKASPELQRIPVIVLTADQKAEVESLTLGAIDFIPKPYPQPEVIKARLRRTIELSEDRDIIRSTERDTLTGLYNREFFYRYAEQYDQYHADTDMDAIVVDINHFHLVNERLGASFGDSVLKRIGAKIRELVGPSGGIVCRRAADTFMIYCPHGQDYRALLEEASGELAGDEAVSTRVRLRMGVYAHADKGLDIERRFDRAKSAADTVRNSFHKNIAYYDNTLHERELYAEQLVEDFHRAVEEKQFLIYFQPKFDVRGETPVLASAEALVRWNHPTLGMISPGVFIPLFENNGLIQQLDEYIWQNVAAQIREWKERLGFAVPISINVSRIDMYDPNLTETFRSILAEYDLRPPELMLEITESAYTQDSDQIIQTVMDLREIGFRIEMDDFGTGYSSLNMISMLPIDALKLDMAFVRRAFDQQKDTRLLEVIIDIADYLSVPVIAEGVETVEQLMALKAIGCDLVQGYYFSSPVPPAEFEAFLIRRREQSVTLPDLYAARAGRRTENKEITFGRISAALATGFESVYYVDAENDHYMEYSASGKYEELQIERSGADFFADSARNIARIVYPGDQERVLAALRKEALLSQLEDGQPFRMIYRLMIDGKPAYYMLKATRAGAQDHRHLVVGVVPLDDQVRSCLAPETENVISYTSIAEALSRDYFCIYYVDTETDRFVEYAADETYRSLGIERAGEDFFRTSRENSLKVVFPEDRDIVMEALDKGKLLDALEKDPSYTVTYRLVFNGRPTYVHLKAIRMADKTDKHVIVGVSDIDAQMRREQEQARALRTAKEAANRDALTGVKSKHAFAEAEAYWNELLSRGEAETLAVAVCDLNGLKTVNDTQGHKAGDQYIREASAAICNTFKHSPVYRIGGDEFVVILSGSDYAVRAGLLDTFSRQNAQRAREGGVVVACGLADLQLDRDKRIEEVFERADAAMYENKTFLKGIRG